MDKIIGIFLFIALFAIIFYLFFRNIKNSKWKKPSKPFPANWRIILAEKVGFYNGLDAEEKKLFEFKIQEFLLNCRITGIQTTVNETDKLLVAASAIIPIFAFPSWQYNNIYEILLYPDKFNYNFETSGESRSILGMVGSGYMEGKMILSKNALHYGFKNETDKQNTAIHEFVHLIDKSDGVIDGVPELLLEKQYVIPWIDLIKQKIDEIYKNKSDINPYGATNKAEFFAVISEYFFERPKLLEKKHPELYKLLVEIFNQDMKSKISQSKVIKIGRNDDCPCKSGKKFKDCCGK